MLIEHYQNAAWAVHTDDGIAIYLSSDEAIAAVRNGTVAPTEEDREYYHGVGAYAWYPCPELEESI